MEEAIAAMALATLYNEDIYKKSHGSLKLTRLASSLNGRHSPNALTKVVRFFLGSGLARASIIGFRGFVKKRIICTQRRKCTNFTPAESDYLGE